MEITYTMIGPDGAQYGPISLEQFRVWIAEGRVTGDTKVMRSDTQSWLPAADYVELGLARESAPVVPVSPRVITPGYVRIEPQLERRIHQGARWFFWVAGLSVVNTVLAFSHTSFGFIIGTLGMTGLFDALLSRMTSNEYVPLVVNFAMAGVYALFGFFAMRRQSWSFIVGMIFYALDALLIFFTQAWLTFGFHIFVLVCIFVGLKANLKSKRLA